MPVEWVKIELVGLYVGPFVKVFRNTTPLQLGGFKHNLIISWSSAN